MFILSIKGVLTPTLSDCLNETCAVIFCICVHGAGNGSFVFTPNNTLTIQPHTVH